MKTIIIALFLFVSSFVYAQEKHKHIAIVYFTYGQRNMALRVKSFLIREKGRVRFISIRDDNIVTINGHFVIIEPYQEIVKNEEEK